MCLLGFSVREQCGQQGLTVNPMPVPAPNLISIRAPATTATMTTTIFATATELGALFCSLGYTISDTAIRTLQEAARQQNVPELWLKSAPKSRTYWKKKQGFLLTSGEEMYRVVPPKAA